MDLLRIWDVAFSIDLVGDCVSPFDDCFKIECLFAGDAGYGLWESSFFATILFRTMSTGTGFIMTFELFLLEFERVSSFSTAWDGPQLISFEDLIIYTPFLGEASTFSLNLSKRFFIPLVFIIFSISSSCFCFLFI